MLKVLRATMAAMTLSAVSCAAVDLPETQQRAANAGGQVLEEYPLVKDGRAVSGILLDRMSVNATASYAALELADYLEKITGAKVPIRATKSDGTYNVHLTLRESYWTNLPEAARKRSNLIKDDGFVLAAGKDGVYVVGATPRGVLYGVYEILKKCGDVRWIMPGPDGEFCPRKATFCIPEQLTLVNPSFKLRRFNLVCGGAKHDTYEWLLRNNMMVCGRNEWPGFEKYSPWVQAGGHIFSTLLPDALFDTRPELFGLYKGKRTPQSGRLDIEPGKHQLGGQANQPCTSNPETARIMCENLVKLLGKTPKAESFCILNNDSTAWCECENCLKLDPPEERARGLVGTRYWTLANQLVEAGKKEFPKVDFGISAYQTFQEPPTGIAPDTRVAVDFCLHHRCYLHSIGDELCELNKRYRDILAKWRALGMPLTTYEYTDCLPHGEVMYLPLEKVVANDLKYYKKIGNFGYCDEVPPFDPEYDAKSPWNNRVIKESWRANWLAIYMKACFMWNADADYDAVLEDVGSKFYGKAWPQMKKYKTLLREAYERTNSHFCYGTEFVNLGKCLEYPMAEKTLDNYLAEAEAAAGDDEKLLKRIRQEREYFHLSFPESHKLYTEKVKSSQVAAGKRAGKIVIDGVADEADWHMADFGHDFVKNGKPKEAAETETHIRILYDKDNLYLHAIAYEPPQGKTGGNNSVEFLIANPSLEADNKYVLLNVDSKGVLDDAIGSSPETMDKSFDSKAEVKTKSGEGWWTAELRVPASALGKPPITGESWKMNVVRRRTMADGAERLSSWNNGEFHGPQAYRLVSFGNYPIVKNGDFADLKKNDAKEKETECANVPTVWGIRGFSSVEEGDAVVGKYFLSGNGFVFQYLYGLQGMTQTYGIPDIYKGKLRVSAKCRGIGSASFRIVALDDKGGHGSKEEFNKNVDSKEWTRVEWVYDAKDNKTGLLLLYVFAHGKEMNLDDVSVIYEKEQQ